MNRTTFEAELTGAGYTEIEAKQIDPKPPNVAHAHDFDIRGLVIDGLFSVWRDDRSTLYRAGEIFDVPAGVTHSEEIGPDGARVVIGRRRAASGKT